MPSYGRQVLSPIIGYPLSALANLQDVDWKSGGLTIDWTTVTAVGTDTTFPDQNVLRTGYKGLRYGQILTKITTGGQFGPYDSAAADGRQLLVRGECYIVHLTVFELALLAGLPAPPSNHPGVFDGGLVWRDRLIITTGAHSLANGPTVAEFEAAFPRISYVKN